MKRFAKGWVVTAALASIGVLALGSGQAHASYSVVLDNDAPTGSGPYTYTYTAGVTSLDQLRSGDYFVIYDFHGYVANSIQAPSGWTATTDMTDPPPANFVLTHMDDPTVPNLVFTYNGTTTNGPVTIDGFKAQSTFPFNGEQRNFVGINTKSSDGSLVSSIGIVQVPAVPEPAGMVSGGIGLILLGASFALRTRRKLAV